jgi:two-component system KDP operon response regulator KdpE
VTVAAAADEAVSILVVEDDRALRQATLAAVTQAGYQAVAVGDGLAAAEAIHAGHFQVVLLDIGLPFVDGWSILSRLEGRDIPSVIVISARGEESDKVRALDMGADDYLAKPFGADELRARIRAVLRRVRPPHEAAPAIRCGDVTVDLQTRIVLRGETEVRLSPTEYVLLAELARQAGHVLDHRLLLQRVWGPGYAGERNYLHTFIRRLRAKLEADPAQPRVIMTAGRHGYRFGPAATADAQAVVPR